MVDVPESTSPIAHIGLDLSTSPDTFAVSFLRNVSSAMGLSYEQVSVDYDAASRPAAQALEDEMRQEMVRYWRIVKHDYAAQFGAAIARNSGRTWYLLFSDDRRQRKRGQRLLGVKRPTGKRTVWKPIDWDAQFLEALREPRDTTWKGPGYDYSR